MTALRLLSAAVLLLSLSIGVSAAPKETEGEKGKKVDGKAAGETGAIAITLPDARNPLPAAILQRMRAKLVELSGGDPAAAIPPAPPQGKPDSGH